MFSLQIKKVVKISITLAITAAFLFSIFGLGVGINANTPTAKCPFGGHLMSICKLNPLEHIEEWQSMFTSIPAKDFMSYLSLLFGILTFLLLGSWKKSYTHDQLWPKIYVSPFYLRKYWIFNPLKEAFSRGILHPKLFS